MLAGYLPFDDDPANPEGDNINLLYKYITTTPLTFPEYVTPHARDLLRRILVPDPRKRADLFEVARHSWLSDYHHVVAHITSNTTNIADIVNAPLPSGKCIAIRIANVHLIAGTDPNDKAGINRSVSVREPRTTAAPPRSSPGQPPNSAQTATDDLGRERAGRATRHTLQPEYVEPQTHTTRGEVAATAAPSGGSSRARTEQGRIVIAPPAETGVKPLPQLPHSPPTSAGYAATAGTQRKVSPPTRPARDVPRSASDSVGAFATAPAQTGMNYSTRPSTGASLTSATGPAGTRSDLRLPSRGSYGQPAPPTVATTSAQGRVTQPPKSTRGYNISGPISHHAAQGSLGQTMTQSMSNNYNDGATMPPPVQSGKGHHRRTSTLSGLGERLFGRSGSVARKRESDQPRQKNGKKYPPTSMKQSITTDGPRASIDSKRSFSFGLGKKRSTDLESQTEKPGRRFSLLPNSVSFKGLLGGGRDQEVGAESPQVGDFPQPPTSQVHSRPDTGSAPYAEKPQNSAMDGHQDGSRPRVANFSRPPQAQQYPNQRYQQAMAPPSNDVYGGTGVYSASQPQGAYQSNQQQFQPRYPEGFNEPSRPSMQQGRPHKGVLTKPNRKFTEAYDNDHHGGSSGAVKKVQDFFRRRGRARADSEY